jgi:hypothetical protein
MKEVVLRIDIVLAGFEPPKLGSNGKHPNHYTTEASVIACWFMLRRVLELKCKGNRLVG